MPASGSIGELVLKFTADIASILTNTERIKKEVQGLSADVSKSIDDIKDTFRTVAEAFAVFESVKFLGNIVTESIAAQASLQQLADKTGITVEQLSALSNTAAIVGVNLEESSNLIFRFEKNVNDAASGTGKAADALRSLGFSAKDLSDFLRDPNAALLTIAGRLGDFQDGIGKTTAELDLFGRAGAQLAPLLKLIADQGLSASTVTAEMAEKAEALTRQWNTMKNEGQQLINQVIAQWVPTFIALLTAFKDTTNTLLGLKAGAADLAADGSLASWGQQAGLAVANFADRTIDLARSLKEMIEEIKLSKNIFVDFVQGLTASALFLSGDYLAAIDIGREALENLKKDWKDIHFVQDIQPSTIAMDAFTAAVIRGSTPLDQYAQEVGTKAPLAVTKFTDSLGKLRGALDEYEKSLATVAKSGAQALLLVQTERGKEALAAAKRQYDEGLISFKEYYDKQVDIANKGFDDQKAALAAEIAAQETLVKAYQNAFDSLAVGNNGIKNNIDLLAAQYKAQTLENNALAALQTLKAKANVLDLQSQQVGKDIIEVYTKENSLLFESVASLNKRIDAVQLENSIIGLTASQIQLVIAQRAEEKLQIDLQSGAITEQMLPALQAEIDKRRQLAAELAKGEDSKNTIAAWQDVLKETETVFTSILNHGKNTFSQLTQWLKDTLIKELIQLAERQFIIPIIAQLSGTSVSGAISSGLTTALGQNPFSLLSSLGGGGASLFGEGGILTGGAAGITDALGVSGAEITAAFGGAAEGAALLEGGLLAAGTAALSFVPILGAAFLAYEYFSSNKEPSPVEGQFGIAAAGTSPSQFEDQAYINTKFGQLMIGFLDQGTQQFSGQAALVFDRVVSNSIDAFATRFSPAQSEQFATVLKNMTFQAFSGTFTTEDFLQKYGGDVLQQVVKAAFDILDPAFGSVVANFKGTADEVAKFSNTLLVIYDATKNFSADFQATIGSALGDATQATADKVLAFVTIVSRFSDVFGGLSPQFAQMSATDIPAFIDALGGAQLAIDKSTFLFNNFLTAAERMTASTTQLQTGFESLGLTTEDLAKAGLTTFPTTHAQFLALLSSFDLTTQKGRDLYAATLNLGGAFVTVHGTADQAAGAVNNAADAVQSLADAAHNLSGNALQSARDFFDQNFTSPAEQQLARTTSDLDKISEATATWGDELHSLGYDAIPTTTQGFHDLVIAAIAAYGADSDFVKGLLLIAPAVKDLGSAAISAANQISSAATTIANAGFGVGAGDITNAAQKFVSKFLSQIDAINQQSTGDFGAKLGLKSGLITDEISSLQAAMDAYAATTGGIVDATIVQYQEEIAALQKTNNQLAGQLGQFTVLKAAYGSSIAEQLVALQTWYDQQKQILKNNSDALAALTGVFDDKWKAIITGTSSGVDGVQSGLAKIIQSIRDFIKQLTISDISPLTPLQKLQAAQQQYNDELARAQAGDQTALADITRTAQAYLTQARAVDASSQAYTDIFNSVVNGLNNLADSAITDIINPPTTTTPPSGTTILPPGYGSPGFGETPGGNKGGGFSQQSGLTALANAVPTDSKLASATDSALLGSKVDHLGTEITDVREAIVALAGIFHRHGQTQVAAIDRSAKVIVAGAAKKPK